MHPKEKYVLGDSTDRDPSPETSATVWQIGNCDGLGVHQNNTIVSRQHRTHQAIISADVICRTTDRSVSESVLSL